MSITIPKTDLPQSDRVRVTLRFEAFSEDGEFATVTDAESHRVDIPLSSILQGDHDSLIVGDSATCDMLREVWADSGLVPDEEPADDSPPPDDVPEDTGEVPAEQALPEQVVPEQAVPEQALSGQTAAPMQDEPAAPLSMDAHNVHRRGRESIEVTLPLTDPERLELAQEMADALAERDRLEADFASIKKDFKTRIDLQVNLAAQAGETYRAGERTQAISCDVFEDRTTAHVIWVDSVSGVEVKRRAMTHEERQLKLPGMDTYIEETSSKKGRKKKAEETPPAQPPEARTCINCGNRNATTDAMPESCRTCRQIESGDADNWLPIRECRTCAHATNKVHMPPCNGCNLNADAAHRGENGGWEWGQAPADPATNAEESTEPSQAMPDMPCVDAEKVGGTTPDEQYTPDELDDIPADVMQEINDDDMPTLPPIGDGTEVRQ